MIFKLSSIIRFHPINLEILQAKRLYFSMDSIIPVKYNERNKLSRRVYPGRATLEILCVCRAILYNFPRDKLNLITIMKMLT